MVAKFVLAFRALKDAIPMLTYVLYGSFWFRKMRFKTAQDCSLEKIIRNLITRQNRGERQNKKTEELVTEIFLGL